MDIQFFETISFYLCLFVRDIVFVFYMGFNKEIKSKKIRNDTAICCFRCGCYSFFGERDACSYIIKKPHKAAIYQKL